MLFILLHGYTYTIIHDYEALVLEELSPDSRWFPKVSAVAKRERQRMRSADTTFNGVIHVFLFFLEKKLLVFLLKIKKPVYILQYELSFGLEA